MTSKTFFESIHVLSNEACFGKRSPIEGFSMSIIENPKNASGFIGIMCQQCEFGSTITNSESPPIMAPHYFHRNLLIEFDSQFSTLSSEELRETTRVVSRYTTNGCKDVRIFPDGKYMTASTKCSDSNWKSEMCFCTINTESSEITSISPLKYYTTTKPTTEDRSSKGHEDWLVLKHLERQDLLYVIQSYNPLRIISVNTKTSDSSLVSMKTVFQVDECTVHGGACIYIPSKKIYIVCVSVHHNNKYLFSHWITLNALYTYTGISDRFRFQRFESVNATEKCTSMVETEDGTVLCTVSMNSDYVMIYEFPITTILATVKD